MISRDELDALIAESGLQPLQTLLADNHYVMADVEWFRHTFAGALRVFCKALRIFGWRAEEMDCDDFARGAAFLASILHHLSAWKHGHIKTALAFGEVWYRDNVQGEHAINLLVTRQHGQLSVLFFEPQNVLSNRDPIVTLTEKEKALCTAVRF